MKTIHAGITFLTILFSVVLGQAHSETLDQDYEVFFINNEYIVRGKIDLEEHFSGDDAAEVIQFALNGLPKSGGTVQIHSGIYRLKKQINIPSHTTLTGSGNGTKLLFEKNHDTGIALSCKASDNTVVKNLSIHAELSNVSAKVGIQIDSCGLTNVENISCIGMQEHGIVLSNCSFLCTVNSCKVAGTGKSGILVNGLFRGGRGGDWVPSKVSNCIVFACETGIECIKSLVINISDCQIYQTNQYGFYIHSESNAVQLTGCRTYQITGKSILVEDSHEINLCGNVFSWSTEEGIILSNVKWGVVVGNNLIDNGSVNLFDPSEDPFIKADPKRPYMKKPKTAEEIKNYTGIVLKNKTMGVTITGNVIYNWPAIPPMKYGVEEDESCFSNNISSNNINYCTIEGVSSKGKETRVNDNQVYTEMPHFRVNSDKPFDSAVIRDYQLFDTRLIKEFIDEIKAGR